MAVSMAGAGKGQLRAWRTRRGWTLAVVSDLTGLTVSYLSLVELGKREPPPATKVLIAERLGCRVRDLWPPAERQAVSA
jgi:transcriptional regulator with XRE-family HTH domain